MYIPAFFSTAANGCPSGYNTYSIGNYTITNLNSGARGRIITNINKGTNDVTGSNFIGVGDWGVIELGNGGSTSFDVIVPPNAGNIGPNLPPRVANYGLVGLDIVFNNYVNALSGDPLVYCYDCRRKWRWTFGSKAGLAAPWPSLASPLNIALLATPTTDIANNASYTASTLNFTYTATGSIEGYGPVFQWNPGSGNSSAYYIISREDITPVYYTLQNCFTSVTASVSATSSLSIGNIIKSNISGLSGSCWNIINSFQDTLITPTYADITISQSFADCNACSASIPPVPVTGSLSVNYLVVAGGGGGGSSNYGGGGGAGGYLSGTTTLVTGSVTYVINVGNGGTAGNNGQSSSIWVSQSINTGYFTASAWGGGAGGHDAVAGAVGGSGGGGGGQDGSGGAASGSQGNQGGRGNSSIPSIYRGGGGGGVYTQGRAGAAGCQGGSGSAWLDGIYYAGGGGGSNDIFGYADGFGIGGIGGGASGSVPGFAAGNGQANTGGGGGGSYASTGGTGGSGVVKIRYAGSGSQATGGTITYNGGYTYHTFTSSGNFITN